MSDRQTDPMSLAVAHFREQMRNVRLVEVPEMGLVGEKAIHVYPSTLLEMQEINRKGGQFGNDVAVLAQTIITRARNKQGRPIFTAADFQRFMREVSPQLIARIVADINDEPRPADLVEEEGEDKPAEG